MQFLHRSGWRGGGSGSSNKTMRGGIYVEASNPGICYTPFVTHVGF